jgi:hypothetical protein
MLTPLSQIQPLQRLKVNDGLLLTAEGWTKAHDYHRQRQNIHFQSLQQPGIVWGLGVCETLPPKEVVEETYRDERWLQIQPGLAIDYNGNPIVVPEPISFRIASKPSLTTSLMVYIVINYVDPDRLQGQSEREFVQETFRIDEKTTLPIATDVELCRVLLKPGEVKLQKATDVLNPNTNQIDLRFRKFAQTRSLQQVRVAQVIRDVNQDITTFNNLSYLANSVPALYPSMQVTVERINMPTNAVQLDYDLIHFDQPHLFSLSESEHQILKTYLLHGAVVMVEVSLQAANILELSTVQHQLSSAITNLLPTDDNTIQQELEVELRAVNDSLQERLQEIITPLCQLSESLNIEVNQNFSNQALRTYPFLFSQFPTVQQQPVYILTIGAFIVIVGSLQTAWGINDALPLSRETVRSAQELGINILYYAWRRHQLTQLQTL